MQALRVNASDAAAQANYDAHIKDMGYALLLKRYAPNVVDATPDQIEKAAWDTVPRVAPIFWSFRIMAGLGFFFIALFGWAFVLSSLRRFEKSKLFLRIALFSLPLPWIAAELGWFIAESGRQPWTIDGILPTFLSVSSVSAGNVWISLSAFVVFYSLLAVVDVTLMLRAIRTGPHFSPADDTPAALSELGALERQRSHARLSNLAGAVVGGPRGGAAHRHRGHGRVRPRHSRSSCRSSARPTRSGASSSTPSAPVWEGNQVWLILGGGAIFAAWPPLYAVAFSGFYLAMLLLLLSLILRPVGFKFRSKIDNRTWRNVWDGALFVGGLVPALVFGVAFGNVLQGVPFRFDPDLRMTYEGTVFGLFNPFALLSGLVSVAMIVMHGGVWAHGENRVAPQRARRARAATIAAIATVVLFAVAGLLGEPHLRLCADLRRRRPRAVQSAPQDRGARARRPPRHYSVHPWMLAAPALGLLAPLLAVLLLRSKRPAFAFVASALGIRRHHRDPPASASFRSSCRRRSTPNASLTAWDASSSRTTLILMTIATAIFLPIVLAYTAWVYPRAQRAGDGRQTYPAAITPIDGAAMWYFSWILGLSLALRPSR